MRPKISTCYITHPAFCLFAYLILCRAALARLTGMVHSLLYGLSAFWTNIPPLCGCFLFNRGDASTGVDIASFRSVGYLHVGGYCSLLFGKTLSTVWILFPFIRKDALYMVGVVSFHSERRSLHGDGCFLSSGNMLSPGWQSHAFARKDAIIGLSVILSRTGTRSPFLAIYSSFLRTYSRFSITAWPGMVTIC